MAKNHFKTHPKALSLLVLKVQAILGLNFLPLSRLKIAKSRTLTTLSPQRKIQSWKTWSQNCPGSGDPYFLISVCLSLTEAFPSATVPTFLGLVKYDTNFP